MTTATETYVTWGRIVEWAFAHGALTDSITAISIETRYIGTGRLGVVTIHGHAHDKSGKPYEVTDGEGRLRLASWTVTSELLRYLP